MTEQQAEIKRTAEDLLCFFDEVMQAIVRVDLGDPPVAQLSLLELRLLMILGETSKPATLRELAQRSETSLGQCGNAAQRLKSRGLSERRGGARGADRAFALTRKGRRLLQALEAHRRGALEGLIARLEPADRLRLQGATHLLGRDLDRLSGGMLAA